jgi:CBS domain-containing protein
MKAADLMSQEVISINPDADIREAARVMVENDISGLPVINADGQLVGMITERDLLRRRELGTQPRHPRWAQAFLDPTFLEAERSHAKDRTVADVMSPNPLTVTEGTSLREVARLLDTNQVKRLPVVRGKLVVGVISRKDLLRELAKQPEA